MSIFQPLLGLFSMSQTKSRKPTPIVFLFDYSVFLIAGAVAALIWANVHHDSYQAFIEFPQHNSHAEGDETHGLAAAQNDHEDGSADTTNHDASSNTASGNTASGNTETGHASTADSATGENHDSPHGMNIQHFVNDVLMALFFAIAAKEVWESFLPGGALSNFRKAATPLLATLGGIVGPALVYVVGAWVFGKTELARGWAIPCATDIAFSYLFARFIFGAGHPAIAFLLLLAIADDAAGLAILAVFYPQNPLEPWWFVLTGVAMLVAFGFQRFKLHSFWWYLLIPGVLSWLSFYQAGIHASLGLVPIIWLMPHAHTDLGIFRRAELGRHDTLNEFEHFWKNPVEIILGLFALVNAGVAFTSVGTGTWLVLAGLLIGKPVGITLFTWISQKVFKLEIPVGMNYRHIVSLGMVAAIGFTVALFMSTAAFDAKKYPEILDAVKMGALGSFLAAFIAVIGARMLGIRPIKPKTEASS